MSLYHQALFRMATYDLFGIRPQVIEPPTLYKLTRVQHSFNSTEDEEE